VSHLKIAIRYCSRSGSTQKLATAIGSAIGVPAKPISEPLTEPVELLFLGGAPYIAGHLDRHLQQFIQALASQQVTRIAVFSTSNWKGSIVTQVTKNLRDPALQVLHSDFTCRGAFGKLNRQHPTITECAAAGRYAQQIVAQLKDS
jgi:flavodoxin